MPKKNKVRYFLLPQSFLNGLPEKILPFLEIKDAYKQEKYNIDIAPVAFRKAINRAFTADDVTLLAEAFKELSEVTAKFGTEDGNLAHALTHHINQLLAYNVLYNSKKPLIYTIVRVISTLFLSMSVVALTIIVSFAITAPFSVAAPIVIPAIVLALGLLSLMTLYAYKKEIDLTIMQENSTKDFIKIRGAFRKRVSDPYCNPRLWGWGDKDWPYTSKPENIQSTVKNPSNDSSLAYMEPPLPTTAATTATATSMSPSPLTTTTHTAFFPTSHQHPNTDTTTTDAKTENLTSLSDPPLKK